jgi:hypothetical protein
MKNILTLIGLLILSCQVQAQVSFVLSSTLGVGSFPTFVATADVNGDGKVDLICANQFGNTISVLTNNGNGGFVTAGTYSVGSGPNSVATADVNGDGKVDLIVANMNDNTLTVLTNNGSGGFVTVTNYAVGNHPLSVTESDVNGNGKPDLISANYNDNTLTVLTNNGKGGFVFAATYPVGGNPYYVTASDVNGDGKPDLICANSGGNSVSVLTNSGSGRFVLAGTYAVGNGPQYVTTADVNGDGKPDLITANASDNTLTVLTNNGSGGFVISGTYKVSNGPNGPTCVTAADINGDGKVDLISANTDDSTLTVLTNNGNGGFVQAGKFAVGSEPGYVTTADVNGDGKLDLICCDAWASSLTVLTNASPFSPSLVINVNLTNSYVVYGQNYTLSVSATSTNPISYQWYFVPANNSGQAGAYAETFSDFAVGAVVTNGGFGYGNVPNVSFTGGGGSGALGYGTVSNGILIGITVTNAGTGYTSLPAVVIGAPNGYLYGQTNSSLTISNANQNSLGNYFVVITNSSGSVSSSVVNLTLLYPPSIVQNPVDFTGSLDSSNTMSVVASGTPPLFYQWMLNETNVVGATNSDYVITDLTVDTAGSYSVEVANAYGITNSSPATMALLPSLISPFAGAIDIWGQNAVLNVGAVGSGTLYYQWYFNGQAIAGATASSYAMDGIQFTNAGLYNVVVSSIYGSVTNTSYQVVVNPANTSIGLFAGVTIQGTVGYSYNIQSTTNLSDPNSWVTVTNITLTSPIQIWNDNSSDVHNPNNPQKFYQVLPGQ